MPETTSAPKGEQVGVRRAPGRVAPADLLTLLRLPLAVAFVAMTAAEWRLVILALAAASDFLDGMLARRHGSTRLGALLDPVADKLFMLAAFLVVATSGRLALYEIAGVLLRDIVATVAFVATVLTRQPRAIPARLGGKAVTVAQLLTLFAFLADSSLLRPLAWATAGIGTYAIWDYYRAAPVEGRRL
ncbi:MAG TPA: CDP-alcohol phosphatidyltransferase family protein [Gemmatimonadales bacterium]|nr:CDP-alcohol phosphatidyltransferase family protein [Gemmatimonadales bacterium]